jgi:hypothetical protein
MSPLLIGGLVIAVILVVWLINRNKPVSTPLGGTTTQGNGAASSAILPDKPAAAPTSTSAPVIGNVAAAMVPVGKPVKIIRFTKTTPAGYQPTPKGDNSDWRTFAIGEVFAHDYNGTLLKASDYSEARYLTIGMPGWPADRMIDGDINSSAHTYGEAAIHAMQLTLTKPTPLKKLEVFNNQYCCQWRLEGVVIQLIGPAGEMVWTGKLTGEKTVQAFNVPVDA